MNIRRKTVRRLFVLLAGCLLLAGGFALLLVRSARKEQARVAGLRQAALGAYERGDYPAAVSLLGQYVNRSAAESNDADAVYAYAISRERVPMEGHRQISEAITLLQHYLDLAPSDPKDASHELLKLYSVAEYNKLAAALAEKILARNPRDREALRARVTALTKDHHPADALAACRALNQVDPNTIYWQEQELRLMVELKQPNDQVVAHARQLLDSHPNDPHFLAVYAVAQDLTGDHRGAVKSLEAAAQLPPPDAEAAVQLVALLNAIPRVGLADDLLARSDAQFHDARLKHLAAQRLFERHADAELVDKLKDLNAASAASPSGLLGLKAIALYRLDRRVEADAIVEALAARKDDSSVAWAEALGARFPGRPIDPATAVRNFRDAIAREHFNAIFYSFLGDAHQGMGETDEALRDWNIAGLLSRTWGEPFYEMSRTLAATGRAPEALRVADALRRREPGTLESQVAYAIAAWARLQRSPDELKSEPGDKLLKNIVMIRQRVPNEPQTLVAYVALLSQRGRKDNAVAAVRTAIDASTPLPESTFERLLDVDQQEQLGLQQQILDRAQTAYGQTPGIAFARAIALYKAGKSAEAADFVRSLRAAHANDPLWQVADARFRDITRDGGAADAWRAVCDANPADVRVQYAALATPSRFTDRALWQRTIDRVKALTGPDAQAWQVEQARLRLSGQATPQEIDQTIASLDRVAQASPELSDVHRLLAQALLRTGRQNLAERAVAELTSAHDLDPDDFATTAQLAALLAAQGQRDRAEQLVDAVARSPKLTPDQRLWAAGMDGQLGNAADGIKLLTAAAPDGARGDDLLANLYVRAGRIEDAKAVYQKIIDSKQATPDGLVHAADFFATLHQSEKADQCLARLKEMKLDDSSADVLRAHLQEQEGRTADAAGTLTEATRAYPQAEQPWRELAGLYLRREGLDQADKVAAAGLVAIPNAPMLSAMRTQIAGLRTLDPRDVAPLLAPISRDPREPAAQAAVAALADLRARKASPGEAIARLRRVADEYPAFVPLQELVIRRYVAARQFREAADLASRAAELVPSDPEPLRILTEVQATAGDFVAARAAADRWRQLAAADPLPVDLELAQIDLQQPDIDAAGAMELLEPYVADAAPERQRLAATPMYCRALLAAGRIDDAANRLQPLLPKSPQWINVWLDLATSGARNGDIATQWMKRLTPLLPSDAPPGLRIAVASKWERVGAQFDAPAASQTACDLLAPIIAHDTAPAAAWQTWALAQQALGNLPESERGWNELLKLDPASATTKNNLAFVLFLEGTPDKLARAESLAREAVASAPDSSTFYDTLARVEGQLGHRPEAMKDFRSAIEKDPNDVEAMVGLADLLQTQPAGREEARTLLARINTLLQGGTPLLPPIRKELDHVKTALSSSMSVPE